MGILLKYTEIEKVPRGMGLFQVPRVRAFCEVSFYLCQSGKEKWIYSHIKSLGRHKEICRQEKLDGCGARGRETFFFNHITFYTFAILSHVNVLLTDQNI